MPTETITSKRTKSQNLSFVAAGLDIAVKTTIDYPADDSPNVDFKDMVDDIFDAIRQATKEYEGNPNQQKLNLDGGDDDEGPIDNGSDLGIGGDGEAE